MPAFTDVFKQLGVVTGKNFKVRKRHYVAGLFEIATPILLFLLMAYTRSQIKGIAKERIEEPTYVHYETFYMQSFGLYDVQIYYTPSNKFTQKIMEGVGEKLQIPSDKVKTFISEENLLAYYAVHGKNITTYSIIFNDLPENGIPQHLNYSLSVQESGIKWPMNSYFSSSHNYLPGEGSETYRRTGFITLQWTIDEQFIQIATGKSEIPYSVTIQEFPYPPHLRDVGIIDMYTYVLPLITCFSFIFLCPLVLKRIVEEKSTGIKELMKIVGLKQTTIWVAWLIHGLIVNIVSIVVIIILMKVNIFSSDYPPIEYLDGSVYFVFLLLYCCSCTTMCFLISTIFKNGNIAVIFGIVFWMLTYFVPANFVLESEDIGFDNWILKMILSLLPNVAMMLGYKTIAMFEVREIGVHWNNLFDSVTNSQYDVSLGNVFVMLAVNITIFMILTMYIDNLFPGKYGISKPWYFPFSGIVNYISKQFCNKVDEEPLISRTDDKFFESVQFNPGIEIKNLHKRYACKSALNGVTLNIYKGEISVLLGHNGAGKSTVMSIMSGLISPSSGIILINGQNIKVDKQHNDVGFCPQHNMYFIDLTVLEHLIFFAKLKGLSNSEAKSSAKKLLEELNLDGNKFPETLSGGMKRKLNLALALVGDPKVIILDEPTSGMDIESRRFVWDVLLKIRREKTIFISTHFMEEAEALGDRITIMDHGNAICSGSPMFLRKVFGAGYYLSCKFENETERFKIHQIITQYPDIETTNKGTNNEVVYALPFDKKENYAEIFKKLEDNEIQYISIKNTTMEEIFLRSGYQHSPDFKPEKDKDQHIDSSNEDLSSSSGAIKLYEILKKKWNICLKFAFLYIYQLLMAIAIVVLTIYLGTNDSSTASQKNSHLSLDLVKYKENTVYYGWNGDETALQKLMDTYEQITKQPSTTTKRVTDVNNAIISEGLSNILSYKYHLIVAAEFNATPAETNINAMYSNGALHGAPISLNLVMNTILKSLTNESYEISTINAPLPKLSTKLDEEQSMLKSGLLWIFLFPLGLLLLSSLSIVFPYFEQSSKVKNLQFMCGISKINYWLVIFIMDILIYNLFLGFIMVIMTTLYSSVITTNVFGGTQEIGALFIIGLLYGLSSTAFSYFFAYRKTISSCLSAFILYGLAVGLFPTVIVYALFESSIEHWQTVGYILFWIFSFFPQFNLTFALANFCFKAIWKFNWNIKSVGSKMATCRFESNPCCNGDSSACDAYMSYWQGEKNINTQIILMALSTILFLSLIIARDSTRDIKHLLRQLIMKISSPKYQNKQRRNSEQTNNIKVDSIKKRVVTNVSFGVNTGECFGLLGANGAGKTTTFKILSGEENPDMGEIYYGKQKATNNWGEYQRRLGYCPQEDVLNGYLTCKQMLKLFAILRDVKNADEVVDDYITKLGLSEYKDVKCEDLSGGNKRKLNFGMSIIGHPSIILLDEPTTGVDPNSRQNIWRLIKVLKNQELNKNSIILTSHSMDECESLCDRLGIILDGKVTVEGTIPELKKKYESGFTLKFKTKRPRDTILNVDERRSNSDVDETDSIQSQTAPLLGEVKDRIYNTIERKLHAKQVDLIDEHSNLLTYRININEESKKWSDIFNIIEQLKNENNGIIEDYAVSDITLEDVFLNEIKNRTKEENLNKDDQNLSLWKQMIGSCKRKKEAAII